MADAISMPPALAAPPRAKIHPSAIGQTVPANFSQIPNIWSLTPKLLSLDFWDRVGHTDGMLKQLIEMKYESWRGTERMLKATRDPGMVVTLPRVSCLEEPVQEFEEPDGFRPEVS